MPEIVTSVVAPTGTGATATAAPASGAPSVEAKTEVPKTGEADKTAEPKPAEADIAKAESERVSKRFASLARQQSEFIKKQQSFKAEWEPKVAQFEAWQKDLALANRNPTALLSKLYGPQWYEKLTEYKLAGDKPTPELIQAAMDEKLEAFAKQQTEQSQKAKAAQEARYRQEFEGEISAFIDSHPDDYELTRLQGMNELVLWRIEHDFQKTGKLMSIKEAADLVEQGLTQQAEKIRAAKRFAPKAEPPAAKQNAASAQPRTLSNDMTVSTPSVYNPAKSEAERMRRAMEAINSVTAKQG